MHFFFLSCLHTCKHNFLLDFCQLCYTHFPLPMLRFTVCFLWKFSNRRCVSLAILFPHGGIQWHTSASYALSCQMPFGRLCNKSKNDGLLKGTFYLYWHTTNIHFWHLGQCNKTRGISFVYYSLHWVEIPVQTFTPSTHQARYTNLILPHFYPIPRVTRAFHSNSFFSKNCCIMEQTPERMLIWSLQS